MVFFLFFPLMFLYAIIYITYICVMYIIYILLLSTQTTSVGRKHGCSKLKVHLLLNWEGLNGPVMAGDLVISISVQKLDIPPSITLK